MQELKPCPFCGGAAKLRHDFTVADVCGTAFVECLGCLATTDIFDSCVGGTVEDAIKAWNRRVADKEGK